MNIVIEGLNKSVADHMITDCSERIFVGKSLTYNGLVDVTINEHAIINVYDDVIFFDLGGKLTRLCNCDFFTITIQ